jgi:hypothetical protein
VLDIFAAVQALERELGRSAGSGSEATRDTRPAL